MIAAELHDHDDDPLGWCDSQTEFEFTLDLLLDGLDRRRRQDAGVAVHDRDECGVDASKCEVGGDCRVGRASTENLTLDETASNRFVRSAKSQRFVGAAS